MCRVAAEVSLSSLLILTVTAGDAFQSSGPPHPVPRCQVWGLDGAGKGSGHSDIESHTKRPVTHIRDPLVKQVSKAGIPYHRSTFDFFLTLTC